MPIDSQLSPKISPGLLVFTGTSGTVMKGFGISLAIFGLYGTIVLHRGEYPHHSALLYFLGPLIFPTLAAACYTLFPFQPYRGIVYAEKTYDVDREDPSIARLLELLKSREARIHIWAEAFRVGAILFCSMAAFAAIEKRSLTWSFSPEDFGGVALGLMGSVIAVSSGYIGWGLTIWAQRERVSRTEANNTVLS